jgi:hypothetical protein
MGRLAHSQNKPFFLTEYGNMDLGWGTDDPAPKSFEAALSNANDVIRTLRAGADGVNRWSFTNRGDLDGQWQMIQTFNRDNLTYLWDYTLYFWPFFHYSTLGLYPFFAIFILVF